MTACKKIISWSAIAACGVWLTSCYFGANDSYHKIAKDFYLVCWDEHCKIVLNKDGDPNFFDKGIVEQSVYALGNNSDFILVKQHPNQKEEIENRIFGKRNGSWDYELIDPRDTIYLTRQDSIYSIGDKWFHTKNEWTKPDSLMPNKKITNYYIIDIRWYNEGYKVHHFDNVKDFNTKRFILNVPKDLVFDFYDKTLE